MVICAAWPKGIKLPISAHPETSKLLNQL